MPKACKYESAKGQRKELVMRLLMDRILPHDITWMCYKDHRHVMPFDDISLYSGWIRSEPNKVRYLPERVLRLFGYVQSIPHHLESAENIVTTVEQVDQHWLQYTDYVLTAYMLGSRFACPTDTVPGYMEWYFKISHLTSSLSRRDTP
jgi:hypothetical protein